MSLNQVPQSARRGRTQAGRKRGKRKIESCSPEVADRAGARISQPTCRPLRSRQQLSQTRHVFFGLVGPFAVSTADASNLCHVPCVEILWHRLLLLSGVGAGRRRCCDMSWCICRCTFIRSQASPKPVLADESEQAYHEGLDSTSRT